MEHVKSIAGIQTERRIIYNKLKHGGAALGQGGILSGKADPAYLSAISLKHDKKTNVRTWHIDSFAYNDKEINTFIEVIRNAPLLLKNLAFQYVIRFHPDLTKEWLAKMKDSVCARNRGE